jgi:prolyl 4-hydroxylase
VKKFLSPVEIQHLIDLASGAKGDVNMQPSTVVASGLNGSKDKKVRGLSKHDTRSSTGGWIHRERDVIVDGIFRRVADLLNIDERIMRDQRPPHLIGNDGTDSLPTHDRIVEAMQLLRYEAGEEYTPHHDFTYPSIENRYQPKRYATVLLYLTGEGDVIEDGIRRSRSKKISSSDDGLQGGETTFPRAITTEYHDGVKVQPQSGKAVLFYNVLPDGNMDDLSQHSGGKVVSGVKYVANIWVWDPIIA